MRQNIDKYDGPKDWGFANQHTYGDLRENVNLRFFFIEEEDIKFFKGLIEEQKRIVQAEPEHEYYSYTIYKAEIDRCEFLEKIVYLDHWQAVLSINDLKLELVERI